MAVHYHFLGIFGDDGLQSREQGSKVVKEQAGTNDPELKSWCPRVAGALWQSPFYEIYPCADKKNQGSVRTSQLPKASEGRPRTPPGPLLCSPPANRMIFRLCCPLSPSLPCPLVLWHSQTMLGPGHSLNVLGEATVFSGLSFPICPGGSWWEWARGSRWEGCMLPASPTRLSPPSSFLSRGNYPLMRENYKRSVWPHAQGLWASWERASVLEGELETNAWGVFFGGSTVPSPPSTPIAVPYLDFYGNDSMPGLPMNSLNSIEGPLSALGVMGCFRSLGEACGG